MEDKIFYEGWRVEFIERFYKRLMLFAVVLSLILLFSVCSTGENVKLGYWALAGAGLAAGSDILKSVWIIIKL